MPIIKCYCCDDFVTWIWEEAFLKHGFNDGSITTGTDIVADALREGGYEVTQINFGWHNVVIATIRKDGKDLIPEDAVIGRQSPRDYLPDEVVDFLDLKFPR